MAIWREDLEAALARLDGQGSLDEIYEKVQEVREGVLPPSWRAIVRRELEYNSSDSASYQGRFDLFYRVEGIGKGLWGLRKHLATPSAVDLGEPPRVESTVYRILRDTKLARAIKRLHKDRCQICGLTMRISENMTYSEAHHIKPLGAPHHGPDIESTILVLCPNHHALVDLGGIRLSPSAMVSLPSHQISEDFIDYHNTVIIEAAAARRST